MTLHDILAIVQPILGVISAALFMASVQTLRRSRRLAARVSCQVERLERLEHDVQAVMDDLNEAARYAISVGGQPVADELERLVEKANASVGRMNKRNAAGDYDA